MALPGVAIKAILLSPSCSGSSHPGLQPDWRADASPKTIPTFLPWSFPRMPRVIGWHAQEHTIRKWWSWFKTRLVSLQSTCQREFSWGLSGVPSIPVNEASVRNPGGVMLPPFTWWTLVSHLRLNSSTTVLSEGFFFRFDVYLIVIKGVAE